MSLVADVHDTLLTNDAVLRLISLNAIEVVTEV
jgi:hypothetical protein